MQITKTTNQFWKLLKEISPQDIEDESQIPFRIYVVCNPGDRKGIETILFKSHPLSQILDSSHQVEFMDECPSSYGEKDIIIDSRDTTPLDVNMSQYYFHLRYFGDWRKLILRILECRGDISLSLARHIPAFREHKADQVIRECCMVNAQFVVINSLPAIIPFAIPLLPVSMVGDIVTLTKNQMMMTLKLGVIYGFEADWRSRGMEMLPIFGNAFGWKSIAREVLDLMPAGIGIVPRGAIAYAGTAAIGKVMRAYYSKGVPVSLTAINRQYRDQIDEATRIVKQMLPRFLESRKRHGEGK